MNIFGVIIVLVAVVCQVNFNKNDFISIWNTNNSNSVQVFAAKVLLVSVGDTYLALGPSNNTNSDGLYLNVVHVNQDQMIYDQQNYNYSQSGQNNNGQGGGL